MNPFIYNNVVCRPNWAYGFTLFTLMTSRRGQYRLRARERGSASTYTFLDTHMFFERTQLYRSMGIFNNFKEVCQCGVFFLMCVTRGTTNMYVIYFIF